MRADRSRPQVRATPCLPQLLSIGRRPQCSSPLEARRASAGNEPAPVIGTPQKTTTDFQSQSTGFAGCERAGSGTALSGQCLGHSPSLLGHHGGFFRAECCTWLWTRSRVTCPSSGTACAACRTFPRATPSLQSCPSTDFYTYSYRSLFMANHVAQSSKEIIVNPTLGHARRDHWSCGDHPEESRPGRSSSRKGRSGQSGAVAPDWAAAQRGSRPPRGLGHALRPRPFLGPGSATLG